ncbi:MAG: acyl-CoA thioesterase [Solirubrobacterales bacterium]|nr:acyl-CoA thioesterase [Solirubrobacterales bacterium]MCB0859643.1 acyl-CoA thioesterase [Solirubrobacterales bacterium]HRV59004.1 acyl-CoA thioesterase [Solirubrobacterales bacterium]
MSFEVQTRWQDIDGLGHVNHAAVLNFFEEGRDAFLGKCGLGPVDYVVGRCSVTYLREIKPENRSVSVSCTVERIGRSSFQTSEQIFDGDGRLAVEASFGLVMWDQTKSSPRPITDEERSAMNQQGGE